MLKRASQKCQKYAIPKGKGKRKKKGPLAYLLPICRPKYLIVHRGMKTKRRKGKEGEWKECGVNAIGRCPGLGEVLIMHCTAIVDYIANRTDGDGDGAECKYE